MGKCNRFRGPAYSPKPASIPKAPPILCRYGDYAGRLSHRIRQGAADHKVEGWEMLSGAKQWTRIRERIIDESAAWKNRGIKKDRKFHPITSAIMETCMVIGTDFPRMIRAIHTYATRNDNLHSPINNFVTRGNFPEIANTIHGDLAELGNIMSIEMCEEEQFMRAILLELRDAWFKIREGGEYEIMPFTWILKQALIAEWKAIQDAAVRKKANQAAQSQAIANGTKKRLDALNDKDHLIRQLSIETPPNRLPAPGPIKKRKASGQISPNATARKKAWNTIQQTQKKAVNTFRYS